MPKDTFQLGVSSENDPFEGQDLPPVSTELVDHLKEAFENIPLTSYVDWNMEATFARSHQQVGASKVIAYLAQLSRRDNFVGVNNERRTTESESTDPRRPAARTRG